MVTEKIKVALDNWDFQCPPLSLGKGEGWKDELITKDQRFSQPCLCNNFHKTQQEQVQGTSAGWLGTGKAGVGCTSEGVEVGTTAPHLVFSHLPLYHLGCTCQ